jgi:hypothetical protein
MRGFARQRRKYTFSPELTEQLRLAYASRSKPGISRTLDQLVRRTGWPRHVFKHEARRNGWIAPGQRRPWTDEEMSYLGEAIGVTSLARIARNLGRNLDAVRVKAERLHLSRKPQSGYNQSDLQTAFGVGPEKVRRWLDRGLFGKRHRFGAQVRVSEPNVIRFLREHASEYDLRRVDQEWYKGILFGELANYGDQV